MNKTIAISGTGKCTVSPDTTVIHLHLSSAFPTYDETLSRSAADLNEIRTIFLALGFERDSVKTTSFSVRRETESYREQNAYKERFVGYRYEQRLKVSFPIDNERLGQILFALSNAKVDAELNFEYTVSHPEEVVNRLLASAVKDAKGKAAALSEAAGVTLGEIVEISYSDTEQDYSVRPYRENLACRQAVFSAPPQPEIQPDDIEVSDTVKVVWEIV